MIGLNEQLQEAFAAQSRRELRELKARIRVTARFLEVLKIAKRAMESQRDELEGSLLPDEQPSPPTNNESQLDIKA